MSSINLHALHFLADDDPVTFLPNRYYAYESLTNLLHRWQREHPTLLAVESIGKSRDGREIWVAIVTNRQSGAHQSKPAYYVDGDIHAAEVTASSVALGTIHHLLTGYGTDPVVTDLMDQTTLYVIPRIAVDAVEVFLHSTGNVRSTAAGSTPPVSGLVPEDLNGDGLISMMRVKDPAGPWKISTIDDRVMLKREPHDFAGDAFLILPEGLIANWDGGAIGLGQSAYAGLDFNRNFPHWWQPVWKQPGAGPYPLSEPETRAVADFVLTHPNIHGSMHHHTSIGAILRPSASYPDSDMPPMDLRAYKAIGEIGARLTGYPLISIFHENPINRNQPSYGTFFDWMFDQAGVFAFATELWSLWKAIGWEVTDLIDPIFRRTEAQDVAMLRYLDAEADGRGFTRWQPFDHPQLGPVEIGGWERKFGHMNPPGPLLPQEIDRLIPFTLAAMGSAPRLRLVDSGAEALGDDLWRVWVNVANDGFLPTYGSETWKATGKSQPVQATLDLPETVNLLDQSIATVSIGHLPGRVSHYASFRHDGDYPHLARGHAEWFVRGTPESVVRITVSAIRAGSRTTVVTLNP